jgi:hypothetical protein
VAAGDLTTLASVREFVGKPTSGTAQTQDDELLTSLIVQESKQIHAYTGREFAPVSTASQTRKFAYYGGGRLYFTPYDLQDVTSVTIDTESGDGVALEEDVDFFLFPRNANAGVYTHAELRNCEPVAKSSRHVVRPWREVTVVGTWGFSSVPDDVELAANAQVAFLFRQHSAVPGNVLGDNSTRFGPVGLCSAAMSLLGPYRVVGFGYGS